jgi:hypothetical protein
MLLLLLLLLLLELRVTVKILAARIATVGGFHIKTFWQELFD